MKLFFWSFVLFFLVFVTYGSIMYKEDSMININKRMANLREMMSNQTSHTQLVSNDSSVNIIQHTSNFIRGFITEFAIIGATYGFQHPEYNYRLAVIIVWAWIITLVVPYILIPIILIGIYFHNKKKVAKCNSQNKN